MADVCSIGVDLGGTNLRFAVVAADGALAYHQRIDRPHDPEEITAAIREGLTRCRQECRTAKAAGIAVPGIIREGVISSNNLGWLDYPLQAELGDVGLPVTVMNDMAAGAVGELYHGRARGLRNVIFVTISTGIGGGIILDGEVYSGANGLAGEVGHSVVDLNGLLCGCGRRGCWEMIASGTAHRRRIREAYHNGTWPNLDHEPTPAEVTERVAHGDRAALALILRTARYIGIGVSNLTNLYDPEAIIFTGGFARNNWEIIYDYLLAEVRSQAFSQKVQLLLTELGDDAGVVGAAALALRRCGAA